jgi:hypothetical protein
MTLSEISCSALNLLPVQDIYSCLVPVALTKSSSRGSRSEIFTRHRNQADTRNQARFSRIRRAEYQSRLEVV